VGGGSAADPRPPVFSDDRFAYRGAPDERLRVLIVEDHLLFADLLLRSLHPHGWIEVIGCAMNGRDGVVLAKATKPHVVLMDLDMPLLSGIDATREILACVSATVIVLTASTGASEHREALAAGAHAVLPKSVDLDRLIGHLRAVHAGIAGGVAAPVATLH
jgi:DNA-binding NarL/FixJ family response regulator